MANTPANLLAQCAAATEDVTHISLHTGEPGTTGASEVTGGEYERVSRGYAEPEIGEVDGVARATASLTAPCTFQVPAETQPTHWGAWAGATFKHGDAIGDPPAEPFGVDAQYTLADAPYVVEERLSEAEVESA